MHLPLLCLLACEPATIHLGGTTPGKTDGTGTTDTTPTATDTTTDPGTVTEALVLSDLSWRLHDEIESVVYVSWTQDRDATMHVEYSFDQDVWLSTPPFDAVAGPDEQVVVGIPYATSASWRVVADDGTSVDGETITTGDLPANLPVGELITYEEDQTLPEGKYLLTSINERNGGWTTGNYWTFIIDRQARVVWAHEAPDSHWTLYATVSNTGDYFMWDEATYWSDWGNGEDGLIHRTWLDEEIEAVAAPGLHHAFVQLPDGTLVWGSQAHGGGEALVEQAPGATDQTIIWTCDDHQVWRCESNGLFYNPADNTYLYSFYTDNTLFEIDRATGDSNWWAGEFDGGYTFDPPESQFAWQHGVTWTDAGTLLLSSEYYPNGQRDAETWLLEYDVDRDNGVLHQVWGNSSGTLAETNGDAWRLSNGNTLHMVGAASVIREVNPDGADVWRIDFHGTRLLGRGEFIEDLYTLVKPHGS